MASAACILPQRRISPTWQARLRHGDELEMNLNHGLAALAKGAHSPRRTVRTVRSLVIGVNGHGVTS
jgi:hypothetical protein